MLFRVLTRLCHFVQLSELLVDILLVVVQILRLCAPFRQSGVAAFVDFSSSLALLVVMLSLFSVFWRCLLQHYFVVIYCSEVPPQLGLRHFVIILFAVGAGAPQQCSLQQRGLLFVRSGFTPSGLGDSLPLRFVGLQHHCVILCHGVIDPWFVQHRWVVIDPRVSVVRLL